MKALLYSTIAYISLLFVFAQPPGSPKDTPPDDTSTVQMDGAKARYRQPNQDTVRVPERNKPRPQTKKK